VVRDARTRQRDALHRPFDALARQFEAALMQSVNAIDGAARVQADDQAKEIDRHMQAIEARLGELELVHPQGRCNQDPARDPAAMHDLLRERLHKIDFRHVERAIRDLLDGEAAGGRAGLFLFQRCGEMHGRLCAERILRILKSKTDRGSFRHLPVEFRPADRNEPGALLRLLAGHLGLDGGGSSGAIDLGQVTGTLCGSMQAGSILLLDIGRCDYLTHERPAALGWIVRDFWPALLDELGRIASGLAGSVTVVALLFFDGPLPEGALPPEHCCTPEAFVRDRVLEIELRHWRSAEVVDWLTHWGGLKGYPAAETRLLAETVLAASRGIPYLVANQLLEQCAALNLAGIPG